MKSNNSTDCPQDFSTAMKEARKRKNGDKPPNMVHEMSILNILLWLYMFEKSIAAILARVSKSSAGAIVKKLVTIGLIHQQNTVTGGFELGVPKLLYTLTPAGLDYVQRHCDDSYRYRWANNPSGLKQGKLYHDLIGQILTLRNLESGSITSYTPESKYTEMNQLGKKRPDILWHMRDGTTKALEVELTKKTGRDLDMLVFRIVESLTTPIAEDQIGSYLLVTDKPGIESSYRQAMQVGAPLTEWQKSKGNRWVRIEGNKRIPASIEGRFETICQSDFFAQLRIRKAGGKCHE